MGYSGNKATLQCWAKIRNPINNCSSDKKSGMCKFLYVSQLRFLQLLNFILSYTKFDDIYYETILFKELQNKIEKIPARATPHDEEVQQKNHNNNLP